LSARVCQIRHMAAEQGVRPERPEPMDETLLECFLALGLKARIQSAANFANAVEKLRRVRSAQDSEPAA